MSLCTFEDRYSIRSARHTSTLRTVRSLGDLHGNEEKLLQQALELHEAQFGAEHILALRIAHSLGSLYKERSRLVEARELLVRALAGYKKVLGAEHSLTLQTAHSLGCLYIDTSNFDEAHKILARAFAVSKNLFSSEDKLTLSLLESLGFLYQKDGISKKKAERVYEMLLKFQKKALGAEHSSRLNTLYNLGITHLNQGELDKAEETIQRIRRRFKIVPCKNVRLVLEMAYGLGNIYKERGDQAKAEKLYRHVFSGSSYSTFRYTPLDAQNHFRLVSIKNGSWGEPLECKIAHFDLDNAPTYTALSYTWGDPKNTVPIIVNGATFGATQNLYEYLQQMRKSLVRPQEGKSDVEWISVLFWIDALCINQENLVERSAQVQKMGSIYNRASYINIWLGHADDDSDLAMTTLVEIYDYLRDRDKEKSAKDLNESFRNDPTCRAGILSSLRSSSGVLDQRKLNAISNLLQRPWWARIWVVQESSAAIDNENKIVFCGSWWMRWNVVTVVVFAFRRLYVLGDTELWQLANHHHQLALCGQSWASEHSLIGLLKRFWMFKATDPRDHIYALMGLATDEQNRITIDYTKSISEVWQDAFMFILTNSLPGHLFDILGYAPGRLVQNSFTQDTLATGLFSNLITEGLEQIEIPSWIPDFRNVGFFPFPKSRGGDKNSSPGNLVYSAGIVNSRTMIQGVDRNFEPMTQNDALHVKGFIVDTITEVVGFPENPTLDLKDGLKEGLKLYRVDLLRSWAPKEGEKPYICGGSLWEAYTHTVVADIKYNEFGEMISRGGVLDLSASRLALPSFGLHCCVAYTSKGYIALVPFWTQPGCEIWAFIGGQVLYVLASDLEDMAKTYIGECYVHGLMDGEVLEWLKDKRAIIETIIIK